MTATTTRLGPLMLGAMLAGVGCGDSENKLSEVDDGCASPSAEAGVSRSAPLGTQVALTGDASTVRELCGAQSASRGASSVPATLCLRWRTR